VEMDGAYSPCWRYDGWWRWMVPILYAGDMMDGGDGWCPFSMLEI
jgi:hypothetical protein